MAAIRVVHPDGTTDTLSHQYSEVIRKFGKTDLGRLQTFRVEANEISLLEDEDEVYLEDDAGTDVFGGVLKDIERGGASVELVVDSFERYAREGEPTPGGQRRAGVADDTLIREAIDAVPKLSPGTLQQQETGLTFVFSHSSRAKKIRTVEEATPGEVQYNADKTVDYVDELGTDKSDTLTISPEAQNLDGEIKVTENGGEKSLTHLRMLGTGEGEHQRVVNVVPQADTATYENKVTYSSDWEDGDRRIWDSYINKDVSKTSTLETEGLTQIEELNSKFVEVKATLKDVDVKLGDTVHVSKPKENIDQALRIVEWTRIDGSEGLRYECVLSSRQKSREEGGAKDRKDIQRYNRAFEGSPVTMTTGGGRQPVDGTHDYEFSFYYPAEVEYEHRVKLQIKGLNYRAYSQGAASGGGPHTHDVVIGTKTATAQTDSNVIEETGRNSVDFSATTSYQTIATVTPSTSGERVCFNLDQVSRDDTEVTALLMRIYDSTDGVYYPGQSAPAETIVTTTINDFAATRVDLPLEASGHNLEIQVKADSAVSARVGYQWWVEGDHTHDVQIGTETSEETTPTHVHDPDPGIIDFPEYPSNCDVLVNGQSVGVSLGDGTGSFEETVDLAGYLSPGQFNTISVTSDTLGHIQAHMDVDAYRQILGGG